MERIPYRWPVLPQYDLSERGVISMHIPPGVDRQNPQQLRDYGRHCPADWYTPSEHPELMAAIQKIKPDDRDSALAFVHTWGLLGRDHLVSLQDCEGGDPLWWIWAHARTIHWCLEATHALKTGDDGEIPLPGPDDEPFPVAVQGRVQDLGWEVWDPRIPPSRQIALRELLGNIVNQNISGMRRVLRADKTGNVQSYFVFSALIEMIYWHLADKIGGGQIHQCEADDCEAFFFQRDPRQRFCLPEPGKNESACSRRQRMRKYRRDPQRREKERRLERDRYRRSRQQTQP